VDFHPIFGPLLPRWQQEIKWPFLGGPAFLLLLPRVLVRRLIENPEPLEVNHAREDAGRRGMGGVERRLDERRIPRAVFQLKRMVGAPAFSAAVPFP